LWRGTEVTEFPRTATAWPLLPRSRDHHCKPGVVVNAAGAWAAQIAKMVGIDCLWCRLRRMLMPTEPFSDYRTARR